MEDFTKASTYHAAQMTRISEWLKQLHPETDKKRLKMVAVVLHLKLFVDSLNGDMLV